MQSRLIVAMCIYNEEKFIEGTIDSILSKVKDIDVIEILDGRWKNGAAETGTPNSTDKTKSLVDGLSRKYSNRCDIIFRESNQVFENEAAKRNYQLELIEENYGYESYWVFILDGDERLQFTTGDFEVWLKDHLGDMGFIGLMKTFARGGNKSMIVPRFFPGGHGIHYHNKRSMIVHNGDHTIELDYNVNNQMESFGDMTKVQAFLIDRFFLVNFYPQRERARILEKMQYCKFQEEIEQVQKESCSYQQKIRGTEEQIEA